MYRFQVAVVFTNIFVICHCKSQNLHPLSDEFIEGINSKQSVWRAGRNFDSNTPLEQLQQRSGVIINPNSSIKVKTNHSRKHVDTPEDFDARQNWSGCKSIRKVSDQASCGSCWALSCADVMSDRICIHSKGKTQVTVSANDLLTCCTMCGNGCNGGDPKLALNYWIDFGIVSGGGYGTNEGCKSYFLPECSHHMNGSRPTCGPKTQAPKCHRKCDQGSKLKYEDDLTFGKDVYEISKDEEAIKHEIMENGPVVAVYNVYTDFWSYKAGVYKHVDGAFVSAHAVRLIGWGTEKGTPYWLAANTWNEEWGDKGFFKIIRGRNECGIEQKVITGLPEL